MILQSRFLEVQRLRKRVRDLETSITVEQGRDGSRSGAIENPGSKK
jgi:hypothetical protein